MNGYIYRVFVKKPNSLIHFLVTELIRKTNKTLLENCKKIALGLEKKNKKNRYFEKSSRWLLLKI